MEKEQFIQTYIDLESKTFIRKEKNKKMNEWFELMKEQGIVFTLEELLYILNYLRQREIVIRQPFFHHIIYPILSENIEKNNLEAIRAMVSLEEQLRNYNLYTKDYTNNIEGLIDKGLLISPEDKYLLNFFLVNTSNYIAHTLHEIPLGVIYNKDGASEEECDELLELADRLEIVCRKLGDEKEKWIFVCKYYYTTYKEYLGTYERYNGYEDFLEKKYEGVIECEWW